MDDIHALANKLPHVFQRFPVTSRRFARFWTFWGTDQGGRRPRFSTHEYADRVPAETQRVPAETQKVWN